MQFIQGLDLLFSSTHTYHTKHAHIMYIASFTVQRQWRHLPLLTMLTLVIALVPLEQFPQVVKVPFTCTKEEKTPAKCTTHCTFFCMYMPGVIHRGNRDKKPNPFAAMKVGIL